MAEEKKTTTKKAPKTGKPVKRVVENTKRNDTKIRPKRRREGKRGRDAEDDGFDQKIISIRRVTRMFYGGRRMRLSVFLAVGDRNGRVGLGIGKGSDVRSAQEKAFAQAKTQLIQVPLKGNTIPHDITYKYGAAKVLLKPASPGTGVIAGSSMRLIAEVAGIKDMLGKILGTNNKISNAYATLNALKQLRSSKL